MQQTFELLSLELTPGLFCVRIELLGSSFARVPARGVVTEFDGAASSREPVASRKPPRSLDFCAARAASASRGERRESLRPNLRAATTRLQS
mmetsp:Transcript_33180/g.101962  ORF Transcript_33180/g.101962 Transcript_33180/m.101962 type:complete len:92 (-) Transcript_33180:436-711(-)